MLLGRRLTTKVEQDGGFNTIMMRNRNPLFAEKIHHIPSTLAAKAEALHRALCSVLTMGRQGLLVLSDSQTLVRLLNSKEAHNEIHSQLQDIRDILSCFIAISFKFIPSIANHKADSMEKGFRYLEHHVSTF